MDTSTLLIERWHNEIGVARAHPNPSRVREYVDGITSRVPLALTQALESFLARHAEEVILVRSLDIDLDLDTDCDPAHAARAFALRVARQLVESIETQSPAVVRFASQAMHRARFIEDVAHGRAWGQWYHSTFAGLRSLSAGAAIRTVLESDGSTACRTLAAISADAWPRISAVLDVADAARVIAAVRDPGADTNIERVHEMLVDAVRRGCHDSISHPTVLTLVLLAALARAGYTSLAAAVDSAQVAARVICTWRAGNGPRMESIARAANAICDPAGAADLEATREPESRILTAAILGALAADDGSIAVPAALTLESHNTCAAGLIILLDEIDALLDETFRRALPTIEGADAPAAAALAVLACAAGPAQASSVWNDAAWRALLGLDAKLTWRAFVQELSTAGDANRASEALFSHASGYLRGTPANVRFRDAGKRIELSVDCETLLWSSVPPQARDDTTPLDAATRLRVTRSARDDWRALRCELIAECPEAWRAVFTTCAQIAWRRVTQRVPGMLGASLQYLRANLIASRGTCTRIEEGRWCWSSTRAPLHVLLSMSGMSRATRTWHGREIQRIDVEMA